MGGEHALGNTRKRHARKSLHRPSLPLVFFLDIETGRRRPEGNDEIVTLYPDVESAHLIIRSDGEPLLLIEGVVSVKAGIFHRLPGWNEQRPHPGDFLRAVDVDDTFDALSA